MMRRDRRHRCNVYTCIATTITSSSSSNSSLSIRDNGRVNDHSCTDVTMGCIEDTSNKLTMRPFLVREEGATRRRHRIVETPPVAMSV